MRREEIGNALVGHSPTRVLDLQQHPVADHLEADRHRARRVAERIEAVLQQVRDRTTQPLPVSPDRRRVGLDLEIYPDSSALQHLAARRKLGHEPREIHRFRLPPLEGDEIRALRRVYRTYPDSPFVFTTERKGPLTRSAVNKLVTRAGQLTNIPFPVHPHMLRHACGFYLANKGIDTRIIQDYLGHRSIRHTVRYTELTPERFRGLWG